MGRARRWLVLITVALLAGAAACSSTPANDFEAGECTNDDLSGSIDDIGTVSCDDPHTAEAFVQFDIDGDDFPGADEISTQAQEGCTGDRFESYVGVPAQESIYVVSSINPSEQSWDAGDRTVICVITGTSDGSALDGSAKDSAV